MGLFEDRCELEALCGQIEDGMLDLGVPLDRPIPFEEFRALVTDRVEALCPGRVDQVARVIHDLLWPEASRRE